MPTTTNVYNYCPQCGNKLVQSPISGVTRPNCTHCSFIHWGDYSLGVGGVLWRDEKVLLVQRAYNPGKGVWTIPGGYVDQNEGIAEAIVREVKEETGINAKPVSIIALRDRPGEKHDAYIIFLLEDLGGSLEAEAAEVSDLGFFTLEECGALQIAQLSLSAIEASMSGTGFTRKDGVKMIGKSSVLYQI
ncbi:MAG: NUDIX hydrolase [Desulfitobacterium hafniense]|nr:NUDIX hydrolase [Desulfitobacterium hafniense]